MADLLGRPLAVSNAGVDLFADELERTIRGAADADLARDVDEVAVLGRGALPQLGERGQVGLVVGADRQRR